MPPVIKGVYLPITRVVSFSLATSAGGIANPAWIFTEFFTATPSIPGSFPVSSGFLTSSTDSTAFGSQAALQTRIGTWVSRFCSISLFPVAFWLRSSARAVLLGPPFSQRAQPRVPLEPRRRRQYAQRDAILDWALDLETTIKATTCIHACATGRAARRHFELVITARSCDLYECKRIFSGHGRLRGHFCTVLKVLKVYAPSPLEFNPSAFQ